MVDAAEVVVADEDPEAAVVREVLAEVARQEIEEDLIVLLVAVRMIVLINGPETAVVRLKKLLKSIVYRYIKLCMTFHKID